MKRSWAFFLRVCTTRHPFGEYCLIWREWASFDEWILGTEFGGMSFRTLAEHCPTIIHIFFVKAVEKSPVCLHLRCVQETESCPQLWSRLTFTSALRESAVVALRNLLSLSVLSLCTKNPTPGTPTGMSPEGHGQWWGFMAIHLFG